MPVFLKEAHGLDTFACDCCGEIFPRISMHEHHKIKRAGGGQDTRENIAILDAHCHHALHQVEAALKNEKRRLHIPDILLKLYPKNQKARENCLYLATTAALSKDGRNTENVPITADPDYSEFDTDELVHLTPPKVTPRVKELVMRVCQEMTHPRTKRPLGVSTYLKLLVEQDLRKRGLKF